MTKVLKAIWSVYMIPKNNIVFYNSDDHKNNDDCYCWLLLLILLFSIFVIIWSSLALLTIYIHLLSAKCLKAIDKHILHSSLFSSDLNYYRLL